MQLCVPEPLWDKPSKWGFGQETSFSIVFAISEHVRLLFFQKGIGSNPSPSRVSGTLVQIGQVFVSRRSFLAFAHNLPTYIFYPNLTGFSIPFIKKLPRSFRFAADGKGKLNRFSLKSVFTRFPQFPPARRPGRLRS